MFDDLRELVRAQQDEAIRHIHIDKVFKRITFAEARTQETAARQTASDLLTFIDELENPPPPEP